MTRSRKMRKCRYLGNDRVFKPLGVPRCELEEVVVSSEELEALRLCNYEGCSQIQAAEKMHISRGSLQRDLASGATKILEAILHNKVLVVKGEDD